MNETGYEKLKTAVDDFEMTVNALGEIRTISGNLAAAGEKIDALCERMDSASAAVSQQTEDLGGTLGRFERDFQESASALLTVKDELLAGEESTRENNAAALREMQAQNAKKLEVLYTATAEHISGLERDLAGALKAAAGEMRAMIDAESRKTETRLQMIDSRLTALQEVREELESWQKQGCQTRNLAILGSVAACAAAIASVAGLFL